MEVCFPTRKWIEEKAYRTKETIPVGWKRKGSEWKTKSDRMIG
jgi:hypothetical protein